MKTYISLLALLILSTPSFGSDEEEKRIYRGTMTPSGLVAFIEEVEPQLISLKREIENRQGIIHETEDTYSIHEIKILPHYIEVYLKSVEHPSEREMHRFDRIEGKWKRTKRRTFSIFY